MDFIGDKDDGNDGGNYSYKMSKANQCQDIPTPSFTCGHVRAFLPRECVMVAGLKSV